MTKDGIDRCLATPPSDPHDAITAVLSTPDLLLDILCPLIDGDFLPALQLPACEAIARGGDRKFGLVDHGSLYALSLVSKDFHKATSSDQFWREVCRQRWKGKWGCHPRWERAVADYSRSLKDRQQHCKCTDTAATHGDSFWRARYFFEEQDSTRDLISAEELSALVFDFRFWIGEPTVADGGRIVVESGLLRSASTEVRFSDPSPCEERVQNGLSWTARGRLSGHPNPEPGIEWFLDERIGVLQWGYVPDLWWPQGIVRRLKNWGWQIRNPNVCLRSIDPAPSSEIDANTPDNDKEGECNNNLWKDLFDSLETVPFRNHYGVPDMDIPQSEMLWIEHLAEQLPDLHVNGQPVTVNLPLRMFKEPVERTILIRRTTHSSYLIDI